MTWLQVTRDRNVIKPAKGKRQCNCKMKMVTKQIGPGMFQQFQTQECEQCDNVKYARETVTLDVNVEPGMRDRQVSHSRTCILCAARCKRIHERKFKTMKVYYTT